jgi:hypothetical protein
MGLCATADRWALMQHYPGGDFSVWILGAMYTMFVGLAYVRDLTQVQAIQAAKETIQHYEQTVDAYQKYILELKHKCSSES